MDRYAGVIQNDVVNGNGICVSFFVQGCPLHCEGCHNKNTWDFFGGFELPEDYIKKINRMIKANGIYRNFSLLGGEPLCEENIDLSLNIIKEIRNEYEDKIQINIWTGYTFEELFKKKDEKIIEIFSLSDVLVDGRFISECRDITLKMRGSTNQRIIDLKRTIQQGKIILKDYNNV